MNQPIDNLPVDILILSNGPGELSTWVRPVVEELRRQLGEERSQVRISVVLSPCTNASGQEVAIAQRYPEVDRVQGAEHFFPFLLWGKTNENWDWRSQGLVLFLGGDQLFPIIIGKRLGYRIVIYAEWDARWHRWGDRFGIMNPKILTHVSAKQAHKFTVVGDLMAEAGREIRRQKTEDRRQNIEDRSRESGVKSQNFRLASSPSPLPSPSSPPSPSAPSPCPSSSPPPPAPCPLPSSSPLIGLLPGSKPMKLGMGLPLTLAIAEHLHQINPHIQFVIPVAPTLDLPTLASYADRDRNPVIAKLNWGRADLIMGNDTENSLPCLKTPTGLQVTLWQTFPAHDLLAQCDLCLTTIGANTAELAALTVPMIVLLPTQQIEIMRAWDGLLGLLVNLPGVGTPLARLINSIAKYRVGLLAWPNIWAGREIVPELLGNLEPETVANLVLDYLTHPEKLANMQTDLHSVRGEAGAAQKLVQLVCEELKNQR